VAVHLTMDQLRLPTASRFGSSSTPTPMALIGATPMRKRRRTTGDRAGTPSRPIQYNEGADDGRHVNG
jgi:hypothetical protein